MASRTRPRRIVLTALAALAAAAVAGDRASAGEACPAVDEGFQMCSNDLLSGNCAQFVEAAGALAQLYQIQVAEAPDRAPTFLATNWWGCGDARLGDMKVLLLRLGTPGARALLQQEPFSRLPPLGPGPPAPAPPASTVEADCSNQPTPESQDACAAAELGAAQVGYQHARETCRTAVALPLRDALDGSEQAWQQELPAQCDAAALEYDDPRLQRFARSQCLASAMRERTRGMLLAHPECGPPR